MSFTITFTREVAMAVVVLIAVAGGAVLATVLGGA